MQPLLDSNLVFWTLTHPLLKLPHVLRQSHVNFGGREKNTYNCRSYCFWLAGCRQISARLASNNTLIYRGKNISTIARAKTPLLENWESEKCGKVLGKNPNVWNIFFIFFFIFFLHLYLLLCQLQLSGRGKKKKRKKKESNPHQKNLPLNSCIII